MARVGWWSAKKTPPEKIKSFVQSLTNFFILNLFKKKIEAKNKKISKPKTAVNESKRKLRNKKRLQDVKGKQAKGRTLKKETLAKKEALYKLAKGIK